MENNKNPKVDEFITKTQKWQEEFMKLREIVLSCPLNEEIKWGKPCYSYQKENIVLIHGFKDYCALLFIKGVLLKDPKGLLIQQTEHVQAGRQLRFSNVFEIESMESDIKSFIKEAIEAEKSGQEVELKKTSEYTIPEEFQNKLSKDPSLKTAFEKLTPGRQRAYLLYFSTPKQAKTRESRIEKYIPQILTGKGLND
ncbi:YdeI family protein [Anaerocolumna sp. AGMB13025]|uniref:YdeI/OmpD-associated family protein n=1 Tax=Anaerocolumna sp. AGMB13025 TaxID=3039116 RepID=UPI00241EC208|nr:YdeI family protein [Anaerocolumna sp. AGMB13025]WFR59035.1 YdeI family protein [Anaerocolumna sp. AGMB13025]